MILQEWQKMQEFAFGNRFRTVLVSCHFKQKTTRIGEYKFELWIDINPHLLLWFCEVKWVTSRKVITILIILLPLPKQYLSFGEHFNFYATTVFFDKYFIFRNIYNACIVTLWFYCLYSFSCIVRMRFLDIPKICAPFVLYYVDFQVIAAIVYI